MGAKEKPEDDDIDIDESEFDIEIVDDTPEDDKGKNVAEITAESKADEDEAPSEEELRSYSDKVQKRIKTLTAKVHQERRAKESAARQLEEQARLLKGTIDDRNRLTDLINKGEGFWKQTNQQKAEALLSNARKAFKEAYDAGDAEKLADAQQAITKHSIELENTARWNPEPLKKIEAPRPQVQRQTDPKAEDWHSKNQWFGQDNRMTAYALAVHQDLVEAGVSAESSEYYSKVDQEMRKTFPDKFPKTNGASRSNVVAPASRINPKGSRTVVRLTKSQQDIAQRLGISNEDYAREMLKMETTNDR